MKVNLIFNYRKKFYYKIEELDKYIKNEKLFDSKLMPNSLH